MTVRFRHFVIIIHTVASLEARFGGPSRSVPALCEAIAREGHQVDLVSQGLDSAFSKSLIPDRGLVSTTLLPASWVNSERFPITLQYTRRLAALGRSRNAALIHDHGVWLQSNFGSSVAASRLGIPYFSSPRGMLTRWALKQKPLRKHAAWVLYQRRALDNARVLFATSEEEAADFRAAGLKQPIAVIPNGVTLGPASQRLERRAGARTMLFLSRLHRKKGVVELVEAWSLARPQGWRLVIAGPDEGGYRRVVERRIDDLEVQGSIELTGEIDDEAKSRAYEAADVFVLPTHSENFGIVIAEAMAHGLPVITTRGAPWRELEAHAAGWWIEPTVAALSATIQAATTISDDERRSMGSRGRELVATRYGWGKVAADTAAVYRWAICGGDAPACVISG
jgi:glycosyltransferase involved in cell wall biosynthesis